MDYNSGHPLGFGEVIENWKDGKRQSASRVLNLSQVKIICNSPVRRVIIEENDGLKRATGIELVSGEKVLAKKEVIISTGSYRTPGLLMHSGIGPAPTLDKYQIPVVVQNSQVGRNYFDHFSIPLYFKVKSPENGVAAGSSKWTTPGFSKGQPYDFLEWESIPRSILAPGIQADNFANQLSAEADPYS